MYPAVLSEQDTLLRVLAGASLARYGDGEFNLCLGRPAKMQQTDKGIRKRLTDILRVSGDCLVGIPNIQSETPKADFWRRYEDIAWPLLADRPYASAFVSRPDSAPWIDTPEYWQALTSLWRGRAVTLVRGSGTSLTASDLADADVTEIVAAKRDAWSRYPTLLQRVGTPSLAILCLGPTATVLAVDLAAKGVQAVDLGHVGMFLRKHRRGESMIVTDEDRMAVA